MGFGVCIGVVIIVVSLILAASSKEAGSSQRTHSERKSRYQSYGRNLERNYDMFKYVWFPYEYYDIDGLLEKSFVAINIQTTGLNSVYDSILEIAAVRYYNFKETEILHLYINPGFELSSDITALNGITNDMIKNADSQNVALAKLHRFLKGTDILINYNSTFTTAFLSNMKMVAAHMRIVDVMDMARKLGLAGEESSFISICDACGIDMNIKNAVDRAKLCATMFEYIRTTSEFKTAMENQRGELELLREECEKKKQLKIEAARSTLVRNAEQERWLKAVDAYVRRSSLKWEQVRYSASDTGIRFFYMGYRLFVIGVLKTKQFVIINTSSVWYQNNKDLLSFEPSPKSENGYSVRLILHNEKDVGKAAGYIRECAQTCVELANEDTDKKKKYSYRLTEADHIIDEYKTDAYHALNELRM